MLYIPYIHYLTQPSLSTREVGIIILILDIKMRFREIKQLSEVIELINDGVRT